MKGCHVVFHTASPVSLATKDPMTDLVEPAVQGTENVLLQCNKTPSVKRVVVTSSTAAIITNAIETTKANPANEDAWNRTGRTKSLGYCRRTDPMAFNYHRSWYDCRTWCEISCLVESFKFVKSLGSNDPNMTILGAPDIGMGCVDVRDVAEAHIAAAYLDDASGRHVVINQSYSLPKIGQALGKKYSHLDYPIVTSTVPYLLWVLIWLIAPYTGQGLDRQFVKNNWGYTTYLDNTKSKDKLGLVYRDLETSVQEMYQQMIDEKVVKPKNNKK